MIFFYNTFIRLALKFCQKYVIKKIKLSNMSFYCLKTLVIVFYWFFIFFIHLMISNLFTSSYDTL